MLVEVRERLARVEGHLSAADGFKLRPARRPRGTDQSDAGPRIDDGIDREAG